MKLKRIEWRNFKSYSNIPTVIDFDKNYSLNLIVGNNGTGKSSIAEVITFSLYGKIDNFNSSDIPNRINKNLYCKVEVDCDGHDVVIERGISPTIFAVTIDGNKVDTAGKSNVQTLLEETYFKIPYSVFGNTLVLSIDEFKSFVDMSAVDKRNILDKIFGYTVYNDILKYVKEKLKNTNLNINSIEGSIKTSNDYIINYNRQIDEISKNDVSEEDINELRETVNKFESENKKREEILQKIKTAKSELNSDVYENKGRYKELNILIENIDKKIKLIDLGKCPTCGSSLETDEFKHEKENLLSEREKYVSEQNKIKNTLKTVKTRFDLLDRKETTIKKEINGTKIVDLKSELMYMNSMKDKSVDPIIELKKEINENLEKLTNENVELQQMKKTLEIMVEMFGNENGIKKFVSSKYTPIINKYISDTINFMGLDYNLEFDNNFNSKITQSGYDIKYSTLSVGEKKKIDFTCVIAIMKFLKIQNGEVNILFIDELFSNIDTNSVSDMIELLTNLCKEWNLNVYLIHHAPVEGIMFDNIYKTTKPDGFSRLEKLEI